MSYVRIRSLRSPRGYTSELLIKKPWMIMAIFWVLGLLAWTPITFIFSTKDYNIDVNYSPFYLVTIFRLVSWLSVLLLILSLSIIIIKELQLRKKIKQELTHKNKSSIASISCPVTSLKKHNSKFMLHFGFQTKFYLIIFSFWIQWFIPCVLSLLQPCDCIPTIFTNYIYWLTYTVFYYIHVSIF
jgi:hypothetical protein